MNQQLGVQLYPKSKSELFYEYKDSISICTFRNWLKELSNEGKIRKGKKILSVKEVQTVYEELGIPGSFRQLEIEFG
ncbi:hypothetical protein [Dyadobacter aurulentus]|uniref:hypothetical protein n=1 Tax=Dyadobacter sp. UC 10 TaxID=2605428 RepID=UPI0011F10F43|nr:hypothetical protein [Dyadobacter sp. UC 10]KAA0992762.1 hypothetical protein FXO21_22585 [Dyadobacter sp. UC 10]